MMHLHHYFQDHKAFPDRQLAHKGRLCKNRLVQLYRGVNLKEY